MNFTEKKFFVLEIYCIFVLLNFKFKSIKMKTMKEKISDWLLDIAKYLATAVLLSSVFSDLDDMWVYVGVIVSITVTFSLGLILSYKKGKEKK